MNKFVQISIDLWARSFLIKRGKTFCLAHLWPRLLTFNIHLEYKMKMCSFFKRVVPVLVLVSVSVSVSENFLEVLRSRILCLISVGETFTRPLGFQLGFADQRNQSIKVLYCLIVVLYILWLCGF